MTGQVFTSLLNRYLGTDQQHCGLKCLYALGLLSHLGAECPHRREVAAKSRARFGVFFSDDAVQPLRKPQQFDPMRFNPEFFPTKQLLKISGLTSDTP